MALSINLQEFDGPLDLLLYLIKRDEIDIYDIPIYNITQQYLELLDQMKTEKLNIAGDFFVMAATLIRIKTQMLLPRPETDELEQIEDPRQELVFRLIQYKAFKEMAHNVGIVMNEREDNFYRGNNLELDMIAEDQEFDLNINYFLKVFNEMAERISAMKEYSVVSEKVSIEERMNIILQMIQEQNHIRFTQLFETGNSLDLVVSFVSILELTKLQKIRLIQNNLFEEIWLEKL